MQTVAIQKRFQLYFYIKIRLEGLFFKYYTYTYINVHFRFVKYLKQINSRRRRGLLLQ